MNDFITAGELAKLAGTTKRTIIWYDRLGIITPVRVSEEGYRYYRESQVLEYQMVLLMTTLGIPLAEIREYLDKRGDLKTVFLEKKQSIKEQIAQLGFNLRNVETYIKNLEMTGTMIKPEIRTVPPFRVYYIEKTGAYVDIGSFCRELAEMFARKGKDFITISIFRDPDYQPKRSKVLIGVLARPGMNIHPRYRDTVREMVFNPGKVITYTHHGAGELLSFFWKELEKYCRLNRIEIRHEVPDYEIYRKVNADVRKQVFEIYLPIK